MRHVSFVSERAREFGVSLDLMGRVGTFYEGWSLNVGLGGCGWVREGEGRVGSAYGVIFNHLVDFEIRFL